MRGRTRTRTAVTTLFSTLMVALLASPLPVAARGPLPAAAAPVPRVADLAPALGADGTFRGAPGIAGTVDARGWTLVSDLAAGEPPRFAPAGVAVATPLGPWSAVGSNGSGDGALNDGVDAIAVSGTDLYVGGFFANVAGIATADFIAKWNGSAWSALGSNGAGDGALDNGVFALAILGSDLYVGGRFTDAAGISEADVIVKWDGSAWSALGSNGAGDGAFQGTGDLYVAALAVSGTDLYVGGTFTNADGIPEADHVAKWNGSAWSALGSNGAGDGAFGYGAFGGGLLQPSVRALAVSGTDLYVGGFFANVAGIATADFIAKWNGSAWSALGSNGAGDGALDNVTEFGDIPVVYALAVSGTDLYVGGTFTDAAGIPEADYVAKWNGSAWSALGSNGAGNGALDNGVTSLAVSGTDLYVGGGGLTNADGIPPAEQIAKWNGSAWSTLGSNGSGDGALDNGVYALAVSGSDLFVGGLFTDAAGIPEADYVAKWAPTSPATLTSIAVSPANPISPAGTDRQFTATGTYSDSTTVDISALVTWASDTPAVATINGTGLAHGLSVGTSTISATLDAVSGSTVLTVSAVGTASQTIKFPAIHNKTLAQSPLTVKPTASSGLAVSLNSTTPAVCTVGGTTITLVTAGTCTITADQPGDTIYAPAPTVTRSFAVSMASQTIKFNAIHNRTLAQSPLTVNPTASSGLAVTLSSATPTVCTVSGTTITLVAAGTCTITADQPGDTIYAPAPTVSRSFVVKP